MSGIGRYIRQEQKIAAAGQAGIIERWRWGLRLLADPKRVTTNGNLKTGVIDELIRAAAARGYRLSRREVQYRLQAAKTYSTEAQLRTQVRNHEDWTSLREAGFPPADLAGDGPAADYRDPAERAREHARALAALAGDQLSLFPDDTFGPLSTLEDLTKYAEEMRELTARFAHRDSERDAYLKQLVEAAGGNLAATWEEAERALRGEPPPADE